MKKSLLIVGIAFMSMLSIVASTIAPTTSTESNNIEYYKLNPHDPLVPQKPCTSIKPDETFRSEFILALQKAREIYDAAIEGSEFGQYSTETLSVFAEILTEEEAKDVAEMTQEDLIAGTIAVNDAASAIECNRDISTLTSASEMKWFRLVNKDYNHEYCYNKAITSNGRIVDQKYTYETIDEESDAQLFSFELNKDKTEIVAIMNKATGMYVGTDGMMLSEMPDAMFELIGLDKASFMIKPVGSSNLHAIEAGLDIGNWNTETGTGLAWRIEFVESEAVWIPIDNYKKVLITARNKYNELTKFEGVEFGQYTKASMDAWNAVIVAEEAKNPETITAEEMYNGQATLDAATKGLIVNTDIKSLIATNPDTKYKWFRIINNQFSIGYASGKAISSNGRSETEPYTWEDKDETSDAQLFRFELNATEAKVLNIINKATSLYVDAFGTMMANSTEDNEFEITQIETGHSFWIDPTIETVDEDNPTITYPVEPLYAAHTGSNIVNRLNAVGSASSWIFDYAKTTWISALKQVDESIYKVHVNAGIVTIDGIENFEVYSITGQKQNHKAALEGGVYVVKINNSSKKIIIGI